jgi:antitoxin component of MazEF toxin-antitoxin module
MALTIPTPLRVRKAGNSLVVTIPADVCAQLQIDTDTLLQVTIEPVQIVPKLRPALERHADRLFAENSAALEYLKEH